MAAVPERSNDDGLHRIGVMASLPCPFSTAERLTKRTDGRTMPLAAIGGKMRTFRGMLGAIMLIMSGALAHAGYFEDGYEAYQAGDIVAAAGLIRLGAEEGDPRAQNVMGAMYATGRGVPQDFVLAHMWYNLAGARAWTKEMRDSASRERDALAERMAPSQIGEAQRLAREWQPKTAN